MTMTTYTAERWDNAHQAEQEAYGELSTALVVASAMATNLTLASVARNIDPEESKELIRMAFKNRATLDRVLDRLAEKVPHLAEEGARRDEPIRGIVAMRQGEF